jgi:hypothetical protein
MGHLTNSKLSISEVVNDLGWMFFITVSLIVVIILTDYFQDKIK